MTDIDERLRRQQYIAQVRAENERRYMDDDAPPENRPHRTVSEPEREYWQLPPQEPAKRTAGLDIDWHAVIEQRIRAEHQRMTDIVAEVVASERRRARKVFAEVLAEARADDRAELRRLRDELHDVR